MELKAIPNELRTLFLDELGALIGKYTKVMKEDIEHIKQGLNILEKLEIESKYDTSLESLLKLSELLQAYGVGVAEFYLWSTYCIRKPITIQEANKYIKEIERRGYTEVEGILIYEDGANLDHYIDNLIRNELLTDAYQIKRLIDIDEIIERWMEGDTVGDMVDELKYHDLGELLENPIEEGYITNGDKVLMYVELDL